MQNIAEAPGKTLTQCAKIAHMGNEGKQTYNTKYYNLDMIISIGFRVNSKKAIKFRTWANKIIKDYMVQGFALNDERFLKAKKSDQEYFKRLLERIKLIRTSERMFYQKITDIFAECSIDYNKNSDTAITFYKTIQNKFHSCNYWVNCIHLTQHREIEDLLCFKGITSKYHIKINAIDNIDNCDDLKIVLSILK